MKTYKEIADALLVRKIANSIAIYLAKGIIFLRKFLPMLVVFLGLVGICFA